MRSCLSLSYFLFFHFIYDSSHSLYSRIKLKLIIHYPTYFTDRVSNVIRSVLMMLYCSLSCNTHYTAVAQRQRAGLITPRSPDRNGSAVVYYSCALQKRIVNASDFKQASKHTIHRHGAEAARGAHNSEVTRSKRVAGILLFVCFTEAHSQC
jgi:hypothetical protein